MKKHFILLSRFAVWMLSAMLLTACGDDVQESVNNGNNSETDTEVTVEEGSTLFSDDADDDTRTWMDTNRQFYWSNGDQIYVNTDGANYKKTTSSTLYENDKKANFVLEGVSLTEPKCSVMYIGNGTTAETATASDLKVKIEKTQTQSAWGDSKHLGRSGDCGVAEATKVGNKYSFKLTHKAAYLVFQPHRPPTGNANPDWKLMKIEIIANGTTLAGEYSFGTGNLVSTESSNTVTSVTFNCGTNGFDLNHTAASAANSCFVVIQPGSHELTIRYTVKVTKKPDVMYFDLDEDGIFTVEKTIATKPYSVNGVTTIKHKLGLPFRVYLWDALKPHDRPLYQDINVYEYLRPNPIGPPTTASEIDTHRATNSCKDLPNVNEMCHYLKYGDPHWDETTPWSIDGGLNEFSWGLWLKKKQTILDEGNPFRDDINMDGVDGRLVYTYYVVRNSQEVLPVAERSKYFFLPHLVVNRSYDPPIIVYNRDSVVGTNSAEYWLSSPSQNLSGPQTNPAHDLSFRKTASRVGAHGRHNSAHVVPNWFK